MAGNGPGVRWLRGGCVHMPDPDVDIARNLKSIEWLKTEILSGVSSLYRGMYRNSDEQITEALAHTVIAAYILGKRLGIGFPRLDAKIEQVVKANVEDGHEIEEWYGDFSSLLKYLQNHKR